MTKLLNISEAASIAIHFMALIAQSEKKINTQKLIELTNFSKNHAAKVLQTLVKHNYLKSTRGPTGGFVLSRPPEEINLLEIFETMEGKIETQHCYPGDGQCAFDECVYGDIRERIDYMVIEYLKNRTLKDVKPDKTKLNA